MYGNDKKIKAKINEIENENKMKIFFKELLFEKVNRIWLG